MCLLRSIYQLVPPARSSSVHLGSVHGWRMTMDCVWRIIECCCKGGEWEGVVRRWPCHVKTKASKCLEPRIPGCFWQVCTNRYFDVLGPLDPSCCIMIYLKYFEKYLLKHQSTCLRDRGMYWSWYIECMYDVLQYINFGVLRSSNKKILSEMKNRRAFRCEDDKYLH